MGLGKTIQVLALVLARPQPAGRGEVGNRATLIVTPHTIASQWESQLQAHAPSLRVVTFRGSKDARAGDTLATADVILVTYDILTIDSIAD